MKWFMNNVLNVSSFLKEWVVELIISTNTVTYFIPLMRSFRRDCASNNPVICTELHAGSPSVPPPYD